ncbi:UDP-glucose 6-dehydrogenase [Zalerion maritima]|uniref:UDP-glucose 6-dehydrogenase n=1 Tax=Zalerion maritima TaxID=339359 RepID=A0AAD5RP89_9PEZI|nr:UDP-glucose 6-dehydrogenase [Zalerion maritima]
MQQSGRDPPIDPPSPSLWKNIDRTKLPPLLRDLPDVMPHPPIPKFPNDSLASFGGHGTLEALQVTDMLEQEGIPACMCGVSALIYYGARRLREDWEICVPDVNFKQAENLFKSASCSAEYIQMPSWPYHQVGSLQHTYPRFKKKGIAFKFVLIPDWDAHFECDASNFQISSNGLSYPRLDVLLQSLIDTQDKLALIDLIDGTDLSEQWGHDHLCLDGTTDLEWAKKKNKQIVEANGGNAYTALAVSTQNISRKDLWDSLVRKKGARRGWKTPDTLFSTQYRLHGSPDPWTQDRQCS